MKNLFVLCVTIALLYLGYDALQPPPSPPPVRVMRVAATPAPTAAPKIFFHSALDAPAMATNMTTGTSYFSTDPNSRFVTGSGYGTTGSGLIGGPTYIVVPGGAAAVSANTGTSPLATIQAQQTQRIYYRRPNSPRAMPTPSNLAR